MEGIVFATEFFNSVVGVAGLLILLALAMGGILFGYVAEEEAKGRQIDWLEEPLATAGERKVVQEAKLAKAA